MDSLINITHVKVPELIAQCYETLYGQSEPVVQKEIEDWAERVTLLPPGQSLALDMLGGRTMGQLEFRKAGEALFLDASGYDALIAAQCRQRIRLLRDAGPGEEEILSEALLDSLVRGERQSHALVESMVASRRASAKGMLRIVLPDFFETDRWDYQGGGSRQAMFSFADEAQADRAESRLSEFFDALGMEDDLAHISRSLPLRLEVTLDANLHADLMKSQQRWQERYGAGGRHERSL